MILFTNSAATVLVDPLECGRQGLYGWEDESSGVTRDPIVCEYE
jgi:hypothetical protein